MILAEPSLRLKTHFGVTDLIPCRTFTLFLPYETELQKKPGSSSVPLGHSFNIFESFYFFYQPAKNRGKRFSENVRLSVRPVARSHLFGDF